MGTVLNDTQALLLAEVTDYWGLHGIPPAVTDLAESLGMSRQTIHRGLLVLSEQGFLEAVERRGRLYFKLASRKPMTSSLVPILGEVAAGYDLYATENVRGWLPYRGERREERLFALEVVGDSMVGLGIFSGDRVIVRQQERAENGDLVVALVEQEEATIKLYFREDDEHLRLQSMNPMHPPRIVPAWQVMIRGKVLQVRRDLEWSRT